MNSKNLCAFCGSAVAQFAGKLQPLIVDLVLAISVTIQVPLIKPRNTQNTRNPERAHKMKAETLRYRPPRKAYACAVLMALWLLAISLAAPPHELNHFQDKATHSQKCDFFAHQNQLLQLFSHQPALLVAVTPFQWSQEALPGAPAVLRPKPFGERAPPVDPQG